jgi:hypothetical protein
MAVFTRVNGDSAGTRQVDTGRSFANATIINTGVAAPLQAYKITLGFNGNLAAELAVGGAVETILRQVEGNASVLAYQVDTSQQMSVLVERSSWTDAGLQTAIQTGSGQWTAATGGNIGATGNCYVGTVSAVSSTGGFKLA